MPKWRQQFLFDEAPTFEASRLDAWCRAWEEADDAQRKVLCEDLETVYSHSERVQNGSHEATEE